MTATAKGYSRVSKRIRLPHNMQKAGVVDFILKKVTACSPLLGSFCSELFEAFDERNPKPKHVSNKPGFMFSFAFFPP